MYVRPFSLSTASRTATHRIARASRPMRAVMRAVLLAAIVSLGACRLLPYHFNGGGLPAHIKTMAVIPFENETPTPELQRELNEELRKNLASRLGLREATEDKANAVVRGTIVKYEIDVPEAFSSNPNQAISARRRLQVVIDVEIVDQTTGKTIWSKKGLSAQGSYAENAEAQGRKAAIEKIVTEVIEGAQSQW
jgi:hypothetical protein